MGTSIAGVLGFTDLAQRCSRVVCSRFEDGDASRGDLVAVLHAEERAMTRLRSLLSDEPAAKAA